MRWTDGRRLQGSCASRQEHRTSGRMRKLRWGWPRHRTVVAWTMLAIALLAAIAILPVRTVTFKGTRTERFHYGFGYYKQLAGVTTPTIFLAPGPYPQHFDYCAWVIRDIETGTVKVGINDNPLCLPMKPEEMALHEVCHIRMAHTSAPFDNAMSLATKEAEVSECMKVYDARRENR